MKPAFKATWFEDLPLSTESTVQFHPYPDWNLDLVEPGTIPVVHFLYFFLEIQIGISSGIVDLV